MKLYEYNEAVYELIDPETGEVTDEKALDALNIEREEAIESMCLWYKELLAEAKAIKSEESVLAERRKAAENKAESLKRYIQESLCGEKLKTPRVAVSYRKSSRVVTAPNFVEWAKENADDLLKYKEPEVDKTAIKAAIQAGRKFDFAKIEEVENMTIK